MRVSSAAPVRAFLCLACVAATAAGACTSPDRPGDSGAAGAGGSGGTGSLAGRGGTTSGGGATAGTGGSAAGGGGAGGASATGTAGASGSGNTSGSGGSATGGTAAGAGGTSGPGGSGGSAGSGGASAGSGGTAPAIVIPGAGNCIPPAAANPADAAAAYAKWKTDILTSDGAGGFLRTRRPNSSGAVVNSTVSEGIAYGMLLSVYAQDPNAQPTFDKLWQYSQIHLGTNGLMDWYIGPSGELLGSGAASDADEDMAYALIAADARWGGRGSLTTNYIDLAKTLIGKIWQFEVDHTRADVLKPGDQGFDGSVINISYFAPAYYRVFGRVTGQTANWNNAAKTSYDVIEKTLTAQNGNLNNGLVPAWSTPAGVPMAPPGTSMPIHHQLDSCRTPFRIAVDYCWNAEPRALTYLQKTTGFYAGIGAANIVDGYDLNGTPHPQNVTSGGPRAASFNGPAGAGAMATGATGATLRNEAYAGVATLMQLAGSTYYQESWTGLSLQLMTGLMPLPR